MDIYKASPVLGALIVLNLTMVGGFGWFIWDKDAKTAEYILSLQGDIRGLRAKAIDLAVNCPHGHRR